MILQRLSLSTAIFATVIAMANADPNMRFHGELIDEPCVIKPGDEIIVITLDKVTDSAFYHGVERTKSQQFEIHLSECDLSMDNKVSITFKGDENKAMAGKGFLALSPISRASGIAIGLEDSDGVLLPINQPSKNMALLSTNNTLRFSAFIQAEPTAIANQSIKRGPFSAIATFHLNYD